jgi:hypothetical protein
MEHKTSASWHHLKNETFLEQLEWSTTELKAVVSHARLLALEMKLHAVNVEHLLLAILARAKDSEAAKKLGALNIDEDTLSQRAQKNAQNAGLKAWTGDWLHPDIHLDNSGAFEFIEGQDSSEAFTPDHLFRLLLLCPQTNHLLTELGQSKDQL